MLGENAATMLGRLILAQLQAAAFKRERDGLTESKVPTKNYCLIDECHNFVNHTTGTIVSETRKYGLSLILVQQYTGQGIEPGLFKNIMTNTPLKFTGVGTAGTYQQVAECQQVDRESFMGLQPRRFHVSTSSSLPFIATASPILAGREARLTAAEWREFVAGQLARWYGPGGADGEAAGRGGAVLVAGADPEEYGHERALPSPAGASPPPASPPATPVFGLFGSIRRKLTGQDTKPSAPVPPPPAPPRTSRPLPPPSPSPRMPQPPLPSGPEAPDYEPEAEIAPGVFYSRKKPRFPRP